MFLEIRNTLLRRFWTELVLQQYRLCGEDAIYLIFWIAPFHFRAGIKRVSICERSWEKIEVLHRLEWKGNCSSKPQSCQILSLRVANKSLWGEIDICTFFPGKAAFSVDNFFLKFDFQQVWNFSIWFPDQKRKRSGKRPLRYWGVVSEISQNVQISYFLFLFPNEKISISFPLNCYMFNKLDHKSHPTFLFNFLEAHEIFG